MIWIWCFRALLQFSRAKRDSARPAESKKDGSHFYHELADKVQTLYNDQLLLAISNPRISRLEWGWG